MKKTIAQRLKDKIKPSNRIFIKKNLEISEQISHILNQKGISQKRLAEIMEKEPSEISKLMSGLHNLTLMSIANIEDALGEDIIITPLKAEEKYKKTKYIYLNVAAINSCNNIGCGEYSNGEYKEEKSNIAS